MKKLKRLYLNNSIIQFIVSYIVVLLLPLLICSFGVQIALNVVENNLKDSNMTMLNHSKTILETDLRLVRITAEQIAKSDIIIEVAKDLGTKSPKYYTDAKHGIEKLTDILQYKGINLLKGVSIYFGNSNYLLLDKSMYEGTFYFNKILSNKNQTMDQWRDSMLNLTETGGYYRNMHGVLQFVQPIMGDDGQTIIGSVMFDMDMSKLRSLFSIGKAGEIDNFLIQETNHDKDIIYAVNGNHSKANIENLSFDGKQGITQADEKTIIYTFAEFEDWRYILIVPEKRAMQPLYALKKSQYLLILLATGIGMILAFYVSIRQGESINKIFNIYIPDGNISRNSKNLGQIVSKITLNNKRLMNEIENEKPFVRNAFLNKLIRGEFVNETELKLLAEKSGCDINEPKYAVMVFRLFINNDFYEIDPQTMEEVRIISRLIQKKMQQHLKRDIWFYEMDYLTTFAIFPEKSSSCNGKEIVDVIKKEISAEYNIYPTWGMGNTCTDLLELWRFCEEAKAALKSAKDKNNIYFVHYNEVIAEQTDFYYPDLFEERLRKTVKAGDLYHIHNLLELSKKENFEIRKISRNMFLKLNVKFINTITRIRASKEILEGIERMNEFLLDYYDLPIEEYYNTLENIFIDLTAGFEENKRSRRSVLVIQIVEFIHENYRDPNFGLSMVATKFNISEAYVSTLFKEQTKVNFATYVEKMRIDQACILLKESKLTISEVASEVGYNSIQSFRRAFKKVMEINPSELKNKYI